MNEGEPDSPVSYLSDEHSISDSNMILNKLFSSVSDSTYAFNESSLEDSIFTMENSTIMNLSSLSPNTPQVPFFAGTPIIPNGLETPGNRRLANCTLDSILSQTGETPTQEILRKVGYTEKDIESALSKVKTNRNSDSEKGYFGRNRPTTHVFSNGRVFTYPRLDIPEKCNPHYNTKPVAPCANMNVSLLDPNASSFEPINPSHHIFISLKSIRIKNLNNVIVGQLNINSLRNKFQALTGIIHGNIDILIITETKLDHTFPKNQFRIPGYRLPYRKDRDGHGGGVMVFIRVDIPSDILSKHKMDENIEALFIEVNLRKMKILLVAVYNSPTPKYRKPDDKFFQQIGHALDVYSGYDKFILAGDLNINALCGNEALDDFMDEFHAKNLVKDPTCYANPSNPSCLDLYITNSYRSFQGTTTVATGLSDCHKMVVTVMKTTFPKADPRIITYRDYSLYSADDFAKDLQRNLSIIEEGNYQPFEDVFMNTLQTNHPLKNKTVRANQQSYVSKEMRKGIMNRSRLQHRYWKYGTEDCRIQMKKQENYCNRLYKKERKNWYKNLDPKNIEDERKFWLTMKPLYSDKSSGIREKIMLVENGELIDDVLQIAETFNTFFSNSVDTLGIVENTFLLNPISISDVGIDKCIKMYETHPSIINIKRHVKVDHEFFFRPINASDMEKKIASLNSKNCSGMPTKILRDMRS